MNPSSQSNKYLLPCFFILLGILFYSTIGVRPLANPDEGRYTEIPREMLESGNWISPRLNGVLYFEKPPLFYWLQATALKVGGITEVSARFWTAAFGFIGCIATFLTGQRLFGRRTGIYSALILGSSLLYFSLSQIVTLDMTVSVLITSALFVFLLSIQEPPGRKRIILCHLFFILLALATLTKGLIGVLIPAAIIFLWTLSLNKWRTLWPFYPLTTIPTFLLLAAPWHVLAWIANPEFAWFYFVNEHFLRYLTPDHDRYQPFWFFFVMLPVGLIPWIGFLPQSLRSAFSGGWKNFGNRPEVAFLVIWILFILLFFSASDSKLIPYILPVYPALALLIGRALAGERDVSGPINPRAGVFAFSAISLIMATALPLVVIHRSAKSAPDTLNWAIAAAIILGTGGIIGFVAAARSKRPGILLAPFATMFAFYLIFNPLAERLKYDSTKELTHHLKEINANPANVYSLLDYHQDMAPYFGSRINLAACTPEEQKFGMELQPDAANWLSIEEFLATWKKPLRQFAIAKRKHATLFFEEHPDWKAYLIKESNRYILLSNESREALLFVSNNQPETQTKANPPEISL